MGRATEDERVLHDHLVAGSAYAPHEVVQTMLPKLIRSVESRFQGKNIDPDVTEGAAVNALLDYIEDPTHFNPDKGSLLTYLTIAAYRDVLNEVEKLKKHVVGRLPFEIVENFGSDRNREWEFLFEKLSVYMQIEFSTLSPKQMNILREEFADERDQAVLTLILDGEKTTETFAAVICPDEQDKAMQESIVKREKDKIKKRLTRLKDKFYAP